MGGAPLPFAVTIPWVQLIVPLGRDSTTSFTSCAEAQQAGNATNRKIPKNENPIFLTRISSPFGFLKPQADIKYHRDGKAVNR
jgi:hypothetical protein